MTPWYDPQMTLSRFQVQKIGSKLEILESVLIWNHEKTKNNFNCCPEKASTLNQVAFKFYLFEFNSY